MELDLEKNNMSDIGCTTLVKAIDGGGLPALETLNLDDNPATDAANQAVYDALDRLLARRRGLA